MTENKKLKTQNLKLKTTAKKKKIESFKFFAITLTFAF
jgi:hypothetical protein